MLSTLSRLVIPALVFLLCVAFGGRSGNGVVGAAEQLREASPMLIDTLAWVSAAWLFDRFLRHVIWEKVISGIRGAPVPGLLVQLSGIVVYTLALVGIVGVVFHRSVSGLLAASGAVGIILAMALRSLILDAFSGLAINIDRPFAIGEFIQVHARASDRLRGRVLQIDWRATSIETPEGNVIVVPNSELGAAVITNFSRPSTASEQELILTFDFAIPSERVVRVLEAGLAEAVAASGPLAEPPPKVRLTGVDERGVRYKVVYWCDAAQIGPGKVRHLVLAHVLQHLRVAGLWIAMPKLDAFQAPMPERALDYGDLSYRASLLSRVSLFAGLSRSDVELLAREMIARVVSAGETVVRQGEPGSSLFVLVEGLFEVFLDRDDGGRARRAQMSPGAFFGEISLLTGEPRSATVVAATGGLVFEITKEHMSHLLELRPEVAQTLCDAAARRQQRGASERADGDADAAVPSASAQILGKMRAFFGRVFRLSSPVNGPRA